MKKIKTFFVIVFLLFSLCACKTDNNIENNTEEKLSVVVTTFPLFDWISNILKDNPSGIEVKMLLNNGIDLHNFQPTIKDIMAIRNCGLFVYVGGESDEWVEDVFEDFNDEQPPTINLMEILDESLKEEELIEGMQKEEHEHDRGEEDHNHEEEETEFDEHIWLSLSNAVSCVESLCRELSRVDPTQKDYYEANCAEYISELLNLDREYRDTIGSCKIKTLVFADRFPFRYLVDDYGLDYYAAFKGCSAESEASFETVIFLAHKIDELDLHTIMIIESSDGKIAETVKENTESKDQQIMMLDSLQSSTSTDHENGKTYLSAMRENLEVFRQALN